MDMDRKREQMDYANARPIASTNAFTFPLGVQHMGRKRNLAVETNKRDFHGGSESEHED